MTDSRPGSSPGVPPSSPDAGVELLTRALERWHPEPVVAAAVLSSEPARRLHATLGLAGGAPEPGDPLPPWWQWLWLLDWPPTNELGPDGHPLTGPFLPPIPDRRRMFGGGRQWCPGEAAGLRLGDRVVRTSQVVARRVVAARTGPLALVTVRHEFRAETSSADPVPADPVLIEEQDLIYRSGDGGRRPHRPVPWAPDRRSGELKGEAAVQPFSADAALLFRFSALTGNAHRIHYDHPYATQVESYPDLVVHGPLLAMALTHAALGSACPPGTGPSGLAGPPERATRVAEASFRLAAPMFRGDRVAVIVTRDPGSDDVITSNVIDGSGAVLATGSVRRAGRPPNPSG